MKDKQRTGALRIWWFASRLLACAALGKDASADVEDRRAYRPNHQPERAVTQVHIEDSAQCRGKCCHSARSDSASLVIAEAPQFKTSLEDSLSVVRVNHIRTPVLLA